MQSQKEYINAARQVFSSGLGLVESQEIFNFEYIPRSIQDRVFRIEIQGDSDFTEIAGGSFDQTLTFSIWIGRKLKRKTRMDDYLAIMLDDKKVYINELLNIFTGVPLTIQRFESHDIYSDFIVMRIECSFETREKY